MPVRIKFFRIQHGEFVYVDGADAVISGKLGLRSRKEAAASMAIERNMLAFQLFREKMANPGEETDVLGVTRDAFMLGASRTTSDARNVCVLNINLRCG